MPCEMYTAAEEGRMARERFNEMKAKGDLATRLLCETIKELEAWGEDYYQQVLSEEAKEWWDKHQIEDARRLAEKEERELEEEKHRLEKIAQLQREIEGLNADSRS